MSNENKEYKKDKVIREFKLSTLALKNKNTIFLLAAAILTFGLVAYQRMPKELTPEIVIPTIIVQTAYPGNSPVDIENLITRPIEKEVETVNGIKELTSTSAQGFSMIYVEFNSDVDVKTAKRDVKDAVDMAERELPQDEMRMDPIVMDIEFSEFPIININLSGDYSIEDLNEYAEYLEDEIEKVNEISKVDIRGVNEREVKIDVNPYKMMSFNLNFQAISQAVKSENMSMSAGEMRFDDTKRSIRILGEFESVKEIEDIIIKAKNGNIVYLKDVAEVSFAYADPNSIARLDQNPVVSLQVVKKSGENLLSATDQIFEILDNAVENHQMPDDLKISITDDQSDMIRKQLSNLENSMIMGIILVILVLYYFLGTKNALFVGIAIPMSMFLSFIVLGVQDSTMNMIMLFALILALGLLVDNAIVVVENIYRFVDRGYKPFEAARQAVGEIAMPIITSTATTLSAFVPLLFWVGITGEFMKYLPLTLIIVLTSSLFVALVIVPVFSASFIKVGKKTKFSKPNKKRNFGIAIGMAIVSIPLYIGKVYAPANILMFSAIMIFFNSLVFYKAQYWFQNVFLGRLENVYLRALQFALRKKNPLWFFLGTIALLVIVIMFMRARQPKVIFFPNNDPSYITVRAELPIGTDISATDSLMFKIEKDLKVILKPYEHIVESILTTVGNGAGENFSAGDTPNKGLAIVNFVDFKERDGINTSEILEDVSDALINKYPGVRLAFGKNRMGPPSGKPINLEISGEDFDKLIDITDTIMLIVENSGIKGIEGLRMDLDPDKPEVLVHIDREKAMRFGLSTSWIASTIRTSLFGDEISDFKVGEEEYPIQLRFDEAYRYDLPTLMNQKISFGRKGKDIQIPINSVAEVEYGTTYGSIKRKDLNRVITLSSNVMEGYNANEINKQIELLLSGFEMPSGYEWEFTGEQQEQEESMEFLTTAMLIAVVLILLILVTQFNSVIKPAIIGMSILFSTIGVFLGIAVFKMDIVVVMTGIGIVSLAGIVVNNAIVLIDYIELLKRRKRKELGLPDDAYLSAEEATDCIVQGGKTRLRPVLLTAITTILGLIPLAIGMNIDFAGLLTEFNPDFYIGGDMVAFWGPICWTIVYGLTFSTFLTLIIVPVMYRLTVLLQKKMMNLFGLKYVNGSKIQDPVDK